jgi:pimeloyl-ACP methyl ester carboxylesterase
MESLIALVHSPLVGPFTWSLVAQHLQAGGFDVLVPTLTDSGETPPPYWQQHTACVQQALVSIPQERPLVLVGHSGAGSLLPVLAQAARHPVKAYLFVDAGLPHPGQSQLEEMEASVPAFAQELRRLLASGERFPNWSDEDLREELPDGRVRQQMLAQLQPRSLSFFEEAILNKQLSLCCELYNAGLEERREAYRMCGKSISFTVQSAQLPQIKEIRQEYEDIHSQVLPNRA